jgi:hypothetical protein|tara:strand:+ start:681 stop:1070 length:390 start_codon:yes stop_codon:yes gene_type:complete
MSELIWEKEYGPFKAFGYVAPEEIDVADIFDQGADNVDEIRSDIEQGKKVWVYAQAKVYCKGIELGDGSMGGLLYKDYDGIKKEIFEEDHQGIVHEALREARASMKYLREVKIPAEEQLTSQFMEGQVW